MAVKVLRVFQEFTSAGYVPMPIAGNIDYGVTVANTFPATTPATFQTDDPDIEVDVTEVTDFYVWIRSHGTAWNYLYTRNVRVYPDSPSINNVVMGIIIARLTDAVPYTGATQDTDLGEFGLKAGWLGLDLTPTNTPTDVGTISWDDQDGTANLVLKGGNVNLQIGQEQVTRVVNKTGASLLEANYQAVRISGAQGNRLKVSLAQANNDANSADTIGLVTETIDNNQEGFVTTSGLVKGINTTGSLQSETWVDGDVLYLSGTTAGMITNVKPQAPIHTVIIGYVVRAHATQGQIYVKVDNGYELDELHNVRITTPADKDFLIYDGTNQYWKNRDLFGTTGYLPVYDTTSLLKDSIIYTDGTAIGIGTNVLQSGAVATFGDVAHFTENISLADSKGIVSGGVNMLSRNNLNNQIIIGADGGINDNVAFYAGDLERMRLLANGRLAINKTTASYQVDVQGDVNVSGAFRVNGTIIPNGTVTSVAMSVPTGLVISGSPITSSGTLAVTYAVNYGIPTLTKQSDWDDAYTWVTNFPDQLGNAGKFLTTNGSALSWASLVTGVSSVFGRTGAVVAQSGDYTTAQVTESGNLYYTDARARLALSGGTGITYNNTTGVIAYSGTVYTDSSIRALFSAGAGISYNNTTGVITSTITQYTDAMARASLSFVAGSGAYNSTTGVITIPTNTNQLTNGASFITLASLSASAPLSYNNGTGAFSISQASGSTNGFLSSTDWNTFNNKQNALTNPVTGTGTTNYLSKFTGSTSIGNSLIFDNGTNVGIGTTSPTYKLDVSGTGKFDGSVYAQDVNAYLLNQTSNTTDTKIWSIQNLPTSGQFRIRALNDGMTNGINAIVISRTGISSVSLDFGGAATFNSSVTAGGLLVGNDRLYLNGNLPISNWLSSSLTAGYSVANAYAWVNGDTNLVLGTNGSERMRITSGGNVGIGTSSPSYLLDVNGIGRFSGGYQTPVAIFERNADYGQVITLGRKGVSASAGIGYPADAVISFLTNGSERARIDSSGNLGLGVTPSAWGSSNAMQIGFWTNLSSANAYGTALGFNNYYNGTNYIYTYSNNASMIQQSGGEHRWYTAPSGTAGTAISFTQAMTLTSAGNLLVGTTTDSGEKLQVLGNTMVQGEVRIRRSGTQYGTIYASSGLDLFVESVNNAAIYYNSSASLHFWRNNGTNVMYLNSSGNLGLGVTPQPWTSAHKVIQFGAIGSIETDNDAVAVSNNRYFDGVNRYSANDFASIYVQVNGEHRWLTAPSGIAGNSITFTTPMMLDASGNLMVATTSASNSAGGRGNITIGGSSTSILNFQIGGSLAAYLYHDNNNLNILNSKASGALLLSTNSTEAMRINAGGNVLIGTTTDSGYKLDVNGTGRFSGNVVGNGFTGNQFLRVASDGSDTIGAGGFLAFYNAAFTRGMATQLNASNGYDYWALSAGGWSKIGGLSQSGAATFSSSVTAGGFISTDSTTVTSPIDTGSTKAYISAANINGAALTLISDSVGRTLRLSSNTSGTSIAAIDANSNGLGIGTNTSHPILFSPNATERMRITAAGSVGIGTTSPSNGLLVINSTSATGVRFALESSGTMNGIVALGNNAISGLSTTDMALWTRGVMAFETGASGEKMRITSGGQIYMGNSAGDGYRLQIFGTNQAGSTFGQTYIGVAAYSQWVNSSGAFVMGLDGASGATERMRITSGGDVNIGSSPSTGYKFNVRNASGNYLSFWSPTIGGVATNGFLSHNGGGFNSQVSMGYNATVHVFNGEVTGGGLVQVAGDVNISGAFKINGTAIGTGGGGVSGSGTTNNIAKWSGGTSLTNSLLTDDGVSNVYINGSAVGPASVLNLSTSNTVRAVFGWSNDLFITNKTNNPIRFATNDIERMRLTANGNLLLGNTNASNLIFEFSDGASTSKYTTLSGNLRATGRITQDLTSVRGIGFGYDAGDQLGFIYGTTSGSTASKLGFLVFNGSAWTNKMVINNNTINMNALPTSSAGLSSGDLWKDGSGYLRIV